EWNSDRGRLRRLFHAPERARRRHQRPQDRVGGVRDPVRHQAGRRVLRAAEGQGPRAGEPLQHRHHLLADPQGAGRQGRGLLDGLRHERGVRRPVVSLGVQLPNELLDPGLGRNSLNRPAGRRSRKAEGQEDRPHLPQQRQRQEANPTLEELSKKYQFELSLLAVDHPGQEQKATWLQVRRINPDWIFMSGWGVMNQVAIKEAASIGFRMDRFIGNCGSANGSDVVPAGEGAKGYKGATFHAPGTGYKVHAEIQKFVYDKGKGSSKKEGIGAPLYNRGLVNAMLTAEAIRTAMAKFGNKSLTSEQVRWGFENLNLTEARLDQVGMRGFTHPLKVTCEDHEG